MTNFVWQDEPPSAQYTIGDLPDAEHNIDFSYGESAKDRRNRIAEGFAFAIVTGGFTDSTKLVAVSAVELADALIAELDK